MKKPIERKYILIPETMFDPNRRSSRSRKRHQKLLEYRAKTDISPDECWSLEYALAIWMVPRLALFIKQTIAYPCSYSSLKSWKRALYKMLYMFKKIRDEETPWTKEEDPKFWEGYRLFGRHLLSLWW